MIELSSWRRSPPGRVSVPAVVGLADEGIFSTLVVVRFARRGMGVELLSQSNPWICREILRMVSAPGPTRSFKRQIQGCIFPGAPLDTFQLEVICLS